MLLLEHARHKKVGPTKRLSIEDKYSTEWQKCWKEEFRNLLPPWEDAGIEKHEAQNEVELAIDRCIYYAGWCDKFQVLGGSVNPVSTGHLIFLCQNQRELLAFLVRRTFQF